MDEFDRANLFDPASQSLVAVGTNGIPRSGYDADKNNWAPRAGLAWTLGSKGNTVLRAGYGMYYDQASLAPSEGLYFNSPFFDFNLFFSLPGFPLTLNDPFPSFFPFPLPKSAFAFQRDLRTPYLQHWNVSFQQELGKSRVLEVAYVGSKGTKLITARDINQPRPSPLSPNLRPNPQFDDLTFEDRAPIELKKPQVRSHIGVTSGCRCCRLTLSKSIDTIEFFRARATRTVQGQLQHARRKRAFEFRCKAAALVELRVRSSVWQRPDVSRRRRRVADDSDRLANLWDSNAAERTAVYGCVAFRYRYQQHGPVYAGVRRQ